MVDVGAKAPTRRRAVAQATVKMKPETFQLILGKKAAKGDVLEVARVAGIMAAKQTSALIPMCHPLEIDAIKIDFEPLEPDVIKIISEVNVHAKTGVEMEALTAASVCALTVYDMCKSADRAMVIGEVHLVEKSGGKSGTFAFPG